MNALIDDMQRIETTVVLFIKKRLQTNFNFVSSYLSNNKNRFINKTYLLFFVTLVITGGCF